MSLYHNLIKFAAQNPDLVEHWKPVLEHIASSEDNSGLEKTAFNEESRQFVSWVLMNQDQIRPLTEKDLVKFCERRLGMEVQTAQPKRPGPRFQVGDRVEVKAEGHKDGATIDIYREFDKQIGTVHSTYENDPSLEDDVLVVFDKGSSAPIRLPHANQDKGTGLYSYTAKKSSGQAIEVVYFSDKTRNPTKREVEVAEAYVARGKEKGEDRSFNYYTGWPQSLKQFKNGNINLSCTAQQRGGDWRMFSPKKGSLLYIGVVGDRPSGWKQDYEKRIEEASEGMGATANYGGRGDLAINNYRTGEFVRYATPEEIELYEETHKGAEGVVDGRDYGLPFPIYMD